MADFEEKHANLNKGEKKAEAKKRKDCKERLEGATFKPGSRMMKLWYVCLVAIPIYHGIVTPPMLSFAYDHPTLWIINLCVDLLSFVCVYLGLHMCYYNEEGILVSHTAYTARNYLKGRFFLDLFSSLPIEFIFFSIHPLHPAVTPDQLHYYAFLRVTRLLQLTRLPYVFAWLEADIERKVDVMRLFKYFIYSVMFLLFIASILVLVACPPSAINVSEHLLNEVASTLFCLDHSWVNTSTVQGLQPLSEFDIFTASIYFAALTTISVG